MASLAILGDERPNWRPESYGYELWGCRVRLEFPAVKLWDYRARWAELEQSRNPFAVLVMAHLHTLATRRKPDERYELKWGLIRRLYERGYSRAEIVLLFRFVDWLMALPPELAEKFKERLIEYEEEQEMPYVTSIERLAIEQGHEKGLQQGLQQGLEQGIAQQGQEDIIEVLKVRFEEVPQTVIETIETIYDPDRLKRLHRQAITVESLTQFKQIVSELLSANVDQAQLPSDSSAQ